MPSLEANDGGGSLPLAKIDEGLSLSSLEPDLSTEMGGRIGKADGELPADLRGGSEVMLMGLLTRPLAEETW